jgi:hypothetical protein
VFFNKNKKVHTVPTVKLAQNGGKVNGYKSNVGVECVGIEIGHEEHGVAVFRRVLPSLNNVVVDSQI